MALEGVCAKATIWLNYSFTLHALLIHPCHMHFGFLAFRTHLILKLSDKAQFLFFRNGQGRLPRFFHLMINFLQYSYFIYTIAFIKIRFIINNQLIEIKIKQFRIQTMLSSIIYRSRSQILEQSTYIPHKRFLVQILLVKLVVLAIIFILPPIVNEEIVCILVTVAVSVDFWNSKNMGRKFLNAYWYIDTSGHQDQWVYQATPQAPLEAYEAVFWYSFIAFEIMLIAIAILALMDSKLSLFCAILIGIVCSYINFYAFANIIQMRNSGVLEMIKNEVRDANDFPIQTIKLPLGVISRLQEIPQQNSLQVKESINQ